jgi:hypothetical protein
MNSRFLLTFYVEKDVAERLFFFTVFFHFVGLDVALVTRREVPSTDATP